MQSQWCLNSTCAQECAQKHQGVYHKEDKQCYTFEVLERVCVKINVGLVPGTV
jgi:hypothetical protein